MKKTEQKTHQKETHFVITEGDAFFAHETAVNSNPLHFILDFKNITPRTDVRSRDKNVIAIKHNVVTLEPLHAKQVASMLVKMIQAYEKEFGKIEKTKAMKAFEKKMKKQSNKKEAKITPSYLG